MTSGFVTCPQCSHQVAVGKNFCSKCGYRLGRPAVAGAAPQPAPAQAPAAPAEDDLFQDIASQLFALEAKKVDHPLEEETRQQHHHEKKKAAYVRKGPSPLRTVIYSALVVVVVIYAWGMVLRLAAVGKRRTAEDLVNKSVLTASESGSATAAVPQLEAAISIDSSFWMPYYELSKIYTQTGQTEVALCYYRLGEDAKQKEQQDKQVLQLVAKTVKSLFARKNTQNSTAVNPRACLPGQQNAPAPTSNL